MRTPAADHPVTSIPPVDHKTSQRGFPENPPPVPRPHRHRSKVVQRAVALVILVLLGEALLGEGGLIAMLGARNTRSLLNQKIVALRRENDVLRKTVRLLREDSSAIEDIARRELGLISPGEILFIVP